VPTWTCPDCDRTFGRNRQSHVCVPAITVDEWFADEPPELRGVHDAIVDHLDGVAEVHVEAVAVGIFYKRGRNFAELRPRYDHLALSFILDRRLDHPRFSRVVAWGRRVGHFVPLHGPDDVDDEVRGWLTESCLAAGDG
jgi:hypothetical protein